MRALEVVDRPVLVGARIGARDDGPVERGAHVRSNKLVVLAALGDARDERLGQRHGDVDLLPALLRRIERGEHLTCARWLQDKLDVLLAL